MALFPCVVGNHKYPGPQQSVYAAALKGSFSARSKLRLCPDHLAQLDKWLDEHLVLVSVGEQIVSTVTAFPDSCYVCKGQEGLWQLFANVYQRGQPQRDFYGAACAAHVEEFRDEAQLEL